MSKVSFFRKWVVLVSVFCAFISTKIIGQSSDPGALGKVNIASPNAAALGKYADIPVNNHTGIPQVSIPIYTLQEGTLSLPISASYHAGGLKLTELSSWLGVGWSLNAGGVITRTVRGTPDECYTSEFTKNEKGHLGHNGYDNYIFKSDASSPLPTQDVAYIQDIANGIKDGEPDLFFFNFNGYSGKFYFNDDGKAVLVPESDYKIEYFYEHPGQVSQSIQSFTITTTDGTKYFFGKTDATNDVDPIEKTHTYYYDASQLFVAGTNNTIASWYLNKVQSPDNLFSISLTYVAEQYSYRSVAGVSSASGIYQPSNTSNWKYYDHLVEGVRLSSIAGSQTTLNFEAGAAREDLNESTVAGNFVDAVNTNAKSLAAIQVTNNSTLCKKFKFTYGYFTSDASGLPGGTAFTDQKRLKLEQIKEESCDAVVSLPPHVFEYFTEPIPRRLSFAQDHWGFINGKTTNQNLTPAYVEKKAPYGYFKDISGADRDSDWPAMRAGALKKIIYPTGGHTEFEFEANTTFVSYNKYIKTQRYTLSMGYSGNPSTVYQTFYFSGNPYSLKLTNTNSGGASTFSGASLDGSADPGQTSYSQGVAAAGNHEVSLYKINPSTGNGTEATIYEWVPALVEENRIVGGLRIKKILYNDGIGGPTVSSEYSYNESSGQSSGHLYSKPTYVQFVRNDFIRDAGIYPGYPGYPGYCSPEGYEQCAGTDGTYLISPNSLRPMETTQGNHIGYNEVKVFSTNNGHSIYRYYGSNVWDLDRNDVATRLINVGYIPATEIPNFPEAPRPTDFKRGQLKYDGYFTQGGQLIKEANYYYDFAENPLKTPGLIVGSGTAMVGLPTFYELTVSRKTKTTIQQRVYQPGSGNLETVTEVFYGSNYHNQSTRKLETNSKGEQVESLYKYTADFKPDNCISIDNGLSTYQNNCSTCQTQYYQNRASSGHNTAYWKYWDYQALLKCKSAARIAFFTARKNYFNPAVSGSYANCMTNAKASAGTELKPIFELQDKFIASLIEIATKKNGNLLGAGFTMYDYNGNANGMVYPAKSQKINLAGPSAIFAPSIVNGSLLTKDSRYEDEANYKIENGTIAEVTAKDGVTTSYIWGYNNTLPVVKATGVNYITLKAAYDAVGGNLILIRNQPSLSGAFVNTYFYTPGIGMIKETDPRNRNIFYEYDKLNRLSIVRDHDNNIIKKICYNYAGQQENCTTPCPPNAPPNWQNTTTPPTCQQGGCGNTGYQLQEQRDMNLCSSTYNQLQTALVYNPTACPVSSGATLSYQNTYNLSGFTALYTNNSTGQQYSFSVGNGTGTLGCLPLAAYTLTISKPGNAMWLQFGTGCHTAEGTSATFGKVNVSVGGACTVVSLIPGS